MRILIPLTMLLAGCQSSPVACCPEHTGIGEANIPHGIEPGDGPCRMQDGQRVAPNNLRVVGTEPFWSAEIEGRCVTYRHPGDTDGTRVWTTFSGTAERGIWMGNLDGKPFVLRTRPEIGCSDGMSEKLYLIGASLTVAGEQRTGCAHRDELTGVSLLEQPAAQHR